MGHSHQQSGAELREVDATERTQGIAVSCFGREHLRALRSDAGMQRSVRGAQLLAQDGYSGHLAKTATGVRIDCLADSI